MVILLENAFLSKNRLVISKVLQWNIYYISNIILKQETLRKSTLHFQKTLIGQYFRGLTQYHQPTNILARRGVASSFAKITQKHL